MVDKVLSDLITRVERELSQVPGLNVQTYAKDAIAQKISSTFELVYQDKVWKRFQVRERRTLDGVTGEVTAAFTKILSFDDITRIFAANHSRALSQMSMEYNPDLDLGGFPREYEYSQNAGKLITIHPITAAGDIVVFGQMHPAQDFAIDQIVPFDYLTLVWGAAWQYAVDDASNQGAIQKFSQLFELRKKQMYDAQSDAPISLVGNRGGEYPTRWSDAE